MTTKTTRAATDTAVETAHAGTDMSKELTTKMSGFVADAQRNVTEGFEKFSKGLEGMTSFGQDNVEAVVKSSEIAAKAFEGIGSEISAYSKKSFEDGVAASQDLASAKTMTELFEKQATFAQNTFEGWLHQATKMNEIMAAAAKDITAPIGQRMSAASNAMKGLTL